MVLKDGFSLSRQPNNRKNEDAIFYSKNIVAVIDGCSSKTPQLFDGKSTGRIATELIIEELRKISIQADIEPIEVFERLNQGIFNWYQEHGLLDQARINPNIRPSATFTCYLPSKGEYGTMLSIREHNFMIDGKNYKKSCEIDMQYERIKALTVEVLEVAYGNDSNKIAATVNEVLTPLYNVQPIFQNTNKNRFGYPELDGFLNAQDCIHSDGVFVLELNEKPNLLTLATDGIDSLNVHNVDEALREHFISLQADPNRNETGNYKLYPGNNSFNYDDISLITIDFNSTEENEDLLKCFEKSTATEILNSIETYSLEKKI